MAEVLRAIGYTVDCYEPMVDGTFEEFASQKYDLIILNEVIEHVADITSVFDDLYPVCNTGGIMFICYFDDRCHHK